MAEKYHNSSLAPATPGYGASLRQHLARAPWNFLPLIIAVCGCCATLLLCRVMLARESAQLTQTAALATRNIQSRITSSIATYTAPLEALVARGEQDADPPKWESEAAQLHQRYPVLASIHWVTASYAVRWGVPSVQLNPDTVRRGVDAARDQRKTTVTPVAGASNDGSLLVLIPIFRHGAFDGCVAATLETERWLHSVVDAEIPKGYTASISHRREQIYVHDASVKPGGSPYLVKADVNIYGMPWVVRVWPTYDEWAGSRNISLALSLVIALLIYLSGALAVAARRRARIVEWARGQMAAQQEDLRQANERLEAVIQASPLAIVATDVTGNVRSWNSAAERMFGWAGDEVMNRVPPFLTDEQMDDFRAKLQQAASGELIAGLEKQHRRKDGSSIDIAIWTSPLRDAAGSVSAVIMAFADISERKKLEEQLRHSQKLEAVGRLAGGVAHDFNNLLTIINGYGHMVLDALRPGDRLHTHAEQIVKAGNQAAALTTQLLAFSRRQMIQPKPVDLNHIIAGLEKMLRRVISEHITLETFLSPDLHRVKADTTQMEQVLINLAANARDAMPRGGTLSIRTRNVNLDAPLHCEASDLPPGSYVELSVSDTGEGMDAETRSHLFEPFFTTKERGKGTGLGLSSVYGSVRQNNGGIFVRSRPGSGATFRIYLPQLRDSAPAGNPEPAPARVRRGTETIMLVEDEVALRTMLRQSLSSAGYRVLEASDGADALRQCEREAASIDLLLTDVVMPVLNGRELAQRLAAIAPHVQVIYMSGYADDVLAYHGTLAPGTIVIQKPFSPAALTSKVREVLDARKHPSLPPPRPVYHRANV